MLVDCFTKIGVPKGLQDYISSKKELYIKQGLDENTASNKALNDVKNETAGHLVKLHSDIGNEKFVSKNSGNIDTKQTHVEDVNTKPAIITPTEPPVENETTGIKNAQTLKERNIKGLGEVEVQARRSFGEVFDKGKKMVDEGEINPRVLADTLSKKPRALSPEESVALIYDRMKLHKEHKELMSKIFEASKKEDEISEELLKSELKINEEATLKNDEASRKTGYEQGLGLAARKMMIKEDYSLANQLSRFKIANEGKDLPKETREKLEFLTKKLEEAQLKLEEYETKIKELEAIKNINKQKGTSKVKKSSEEFKNEREDIYKKILDKWRGAGKDGTLSVTVLPYAKQLTAIAPEVAKLIKSYAEQGIIKLEEIVTDIHKNLSANIKEITKEDVMSLLAGEYNEKKSLTPDKRKMEIQANVEKIKRQIDLEKEKIKLSNRSRLKKGVDFFHKWRRMMLLSGVKVLGKIGVAAATRSTIVSPMESIVASGLNKIPYLKEIAKDAPREGAGFNYKAEAKALAQWVDKMTYQDIREVIKTGEGQLDYLYKDKLYPPPTWIDFFGQLHAAIKTLPKRSEFFRSFELRAAHAARNGKDLSEPLIQQEIALEAYNDGLRSIFMNDNYVTDAYKSVIQSLENSKIEGASSAAEVLKFLFPIVKVPTNYVAESTSYMIGGLKAAFALRNGIKDLTPKQKDFIFRALKKQTVGIAFVAIGYFNPQSIGGYYSGKRKDGELEAGDLKLFGVKVPHWMAHTPLLEALQLGSTLRRANDNGGEEGSLVSGIPTAIRGTVGQIPFFNQGGQLSYAFSGIDGFKKYLFRTTQSVVEPQLMKEIAEWTDTDLKNGEKRDPKEFLDYLKINIPGLRQDVPKKGDNTRITNSPSKPKKTHTIYHQ